MRPLYRHSLAQYESTDFLSSPYPTYRYFKKDFIRQFGPYCAFCEVPLFDHLDVQEKIPDNGSVDPQKALIICPICVAHREHYYTQYTCTSDSFLWPDDENNKVFDYFIYTLDNKNLKTDIIDQDLLELLPHYKFKPVDLNKEYKQVWVFPNPKYENNPELFKKIKATICLWGLNSYVPPTVDPSLYDRRVSLRTETWASADKFLKHFIKTTSLSNLKEENRKSMLENIEDNIKIAARSEGFWSVWSTVLKNYERSNAVVLGGFTDTLLYHVFPGTRKDEN